MKKLSIFSTALLLLAACSALAQDVRYNFDKNSDFSKFKTYKWVPIEGATKLNDLVDKQIRDTLDAELTQKGLSKVDTETADLLIGYQAAIGQEKQFSSYSTGYGYGGGWYRGGWYGGAGGMSTTTGQTSTIHIGQLAVDMYDPAGKSRDLGEGQCFHLAFSVMSQTPMDDSPAPGARPGCRRTGPCDRRIPGRLRGLYRRSR